MITNRIKGNQSFGGRLKHQKESQRNRLGKLRQERDAVIYKRLSTYEQVQNSRFSLERQHKLEQMAIDDKYKPALLPEEIEI